MKRAPALLEFLSDYVELYEDVDLEMKKGGKTCEMTVFDENDVELGYIDLYDYATSVEELQRVVEEVGIRKKSPQALEEMYREKAHQEYLFELRKQKAREDALRRNEARMKEEADKAALLEAEKQQKPEEGGEAQQENQQEKAHSEL